MPALLDDTQARLLLHKIAGRDEAALAELHRMIGPRLYGFAFQRSRNHEHAETVVVDTLWEIWQSCDRFRGTSLVSSWIFGIARNKSFELWRAAGPEHEDIDNYADELVCEAGDVSQALESKQESRKILLCIEKLSACQRECMQLAHFEGLGIAAIAEIQQVPENTVKTRLFHARRNLRTCLAQAVVGSPSR
jgi:RNA polymerase sigma-70 factor (ECF subfamily)